MKKNRFKVPLYRKFLSVLGIESLWCFQGEKGKRPFKKQTFINNCTSMVWEKHWAGGQQRKIYVIWYKSRLHLKIRLGGEPERDYLQKEKDVFGTKNWWSMKLDPAMTNELTLTEGKINHWNCSTCQNCINQKLAAENFQSFNTQKRIVKLQLITLVLWTLNLITDPFLIQL